MALELWVKLVEEEEEEGRIEETADTVYRELNWKWNPNSVGFATRRPENKTNGKYVRIRVWCSNDLFEISPQTPKGFWRAGLACMEIRRRESERRYEDGGGDLLDLNSKGNSSSLVRLRTRTSRLLGSFSLSTTHRETLVASSSDRVAKPLNDQSASIAPTPLHPICRWHNLTCQRATIYRMIKHNERRSISDAAAN